MGIINPYNFQIRVGEDLLSGKSVVLQAPTGAGKTLAALMPFIHAQREDVDFSFPRKCIYVVPMRVLAHQFLDKVNEYAKSYQRKFRRQIRYSILTGDQPDDRKFESDLIFCTIDQFLSSYLTMPYSLPNRLANLNTGAEVGAYLVFDEFHLLDPESTLPTAWYAIKQFSKVAPVLLMTATFSKSMLDSLASDLGAEVITVSPKEARQIENRQPVAMPRKRLWQTAESSLSAQAVLENHQSRSLVLCNTVQRAQNLYREIKRIADESNSPIQLLLLHSRFLPEHRREIEGDLHRLFGKGEDCDLTGSVIAIATQTIEVGVDITSEILHTELAPASALIQRAGRCARYPGEQGRVIVYPVEKYSPYATDKEGKAWKDEMQSAFEWLQEYSQKYSDEPFDFEKEQEFVNAVATPRDKKVLQDLFAGRFNRRDEIIRTLGGNRNASDGRLLIRDADSCKVLIHPDPDELLTNPKSAVGFGLQPSSLFGFYEQWQERANELGLEWALKFLYEPDIDKKEENQGDYVWRPLNDKSLISQARTIVVHPGLAGYDHREGFLPDRGNTDFISTLPMNAAQQTWEGFSYQLESYEEHIQRVLAAFENSILPEFEYPALALETAAHWQAGTMLETARLICLLHDVGKLSKGWQTWAHAHQQAVANPINTTMAAAHTDTNKDDPEKQAAAREAARRNPKPHHAAEGAIAVAPILFSLIPEKDLARAALAAITRHHTPFACEYQAYTMDALAAKHIAESLDFMPVEMRRKISPNLIKTHSTSNPSFRELLIKPEQENGWLAYTLLVRALRRADQLGTSYGNK